MTNFTGKKTAVLGSGIEGQAVIDFLVSQQAIITVLDEKEIDAQMRTTWEAQGVTVTIGHFAELSEFDIIVRSPGVQPDIIPLQEARKKGIIITSSTQIFLERAKGMVVGITGTKGKGTTSQLLFNIISAARDSVFLGGNIGKSPLTFLSQLNDQSITVLELSSFQLVDVSLSPHLAIVLIVTSEHLDYHGSQADYVQAKAGITRFQSTSDIVIYNRDYPASAAIANQSAGAKYVVSRSNISNDNSCFVRNNFVTIRYKGEEQQIINVNDITLVGKHNWENVCAAVMAANIVGIDKQHIVQAVQSFRGLEHRLEFVVEKNGVRYYNDSISTTPESTIAAIQSFEQPKILILGGSSKRSDFHQLADVIRTTNIKAMVGLGDEWQQIKSALGETSIQLIEQCHSMDEAVKAIKELATAGDVVLLSPACASFGMFKDYKERGVQFKRAVSEL